MEKQTYDLSIIVVNWKVKDLLKDCLNSVYNTVKNHLFEVIVIDNDSQDGSIEMLKAQFPHVRLVENFENDEEYRQKMISEYKYLEEELMERKADRKSYFCYPLVDENHKVIGLIYLDSSRFNAFRLDNDDSRTTTIVEACENIKNSLI